jgi:hypothetical protein
MVVGHAGGLGAELAAWTAAGRPGGLEPHTGGIGIDGKREHEYQAWLRSWIAAGRPAPPRS